MLKFKRKFRRLKVKNRQTFFLSSSKLEQDRKFGIFRVFFSLSCKISHKTEGNVWQGMSNQGKYLCKLFTNKNVKGKGVPNRPGVAHSVPGGLHSQISMIFGTWSWWGYQPHALTAFTSRKCSWYSFSLGSESTPGPWYGRKENVTEKSIDPTVNRSRDRPTSSAVP